MGREAFGAERMERHHLGVVKRSLGGGSYVIDIYVDGVFKETSPSMTNATAGTAAAINAFTVGLGGNGNTNFFYGRLDDLRLSNKARSAAEILNSYQRGAPLVDLILIIDEGL